MQIKNRTFVLSGGSSGLGLATAKDLHTHGGYVAILDLNADAGKAAAKEFGEKAKFFECDVTDTENIETAIEEVARWTKETGMEIGGVIAAAGVGNPGKVAIYASIAADDTG